MAEYTASIEGTISWNLTTFDYDNTDNNGTIRDKLNITTSESIQYEVFETSFNRTIRSDLQRRESGEIGASYKALVAKVNYETADVSSEIIETIEATTTTTFKANLLKTRTYERDSEHIHASTDKTRYNSPIIVVLVGPYSKLSLYQQRLTAPGMSVAGNAISTKPPSPQKITVEYTVYYGGQPSDAPPGRVSEISGQSDDINYQSAAFTFGSFQSIHTYPAKQPPDSTYSSKAMLVDDLAKGAGGSFRYIRAVNDANQPRKVTRVALFRSNAGIGQLPAPYVGLTGDINANRKKTFLYLLWSTEVAY